MKTLIGFCLLISASFSFGYSFPVSRTFTSRDTLSATALPSPTTSPTVTYTSAQLAQKANEFNIQTQTTAVATGVPAGYRLTVCGDGVHYCCVGKSVSFSSDALCYGMRNWLNFIINEKGWY